MVRGDVILYNQPYFMPNFYSGMAPTMMRGAVGNTALRGLGASRGLGLFSRLGNSINAIRAINWGGIINNTSRTLGIINQTIPLVRQVRPMMNNMRSMLKIASVFKDETDRSSRRQQQNSTSYSTPNSNINRTENSYQNKVNTNENIREDTRESYAEDYSPTFFVAS